MTWTWPAVLISMKTVICLGNTYPNLNNYLTSCMLSKQPACSVQFSSVTQSCPTLCDPMDYSMPGLPVHHQLLEFTQTHVH